jgi:hypothetical protein
MILAAKVWLTLSRADQQDPAIGGRQVAAVSSIVLWLVAQWIKSLTWKRGMVKRSCLIKRIALLVSF